MSSEVQQGLKEIQRRGLAGSLRFAFTSERKRAEAYRNYVALGNREMRDVNSRRFLRGKTRTAYALHAKIFEWCIISYKSGVG
jgi:exonuclease I